MDVGEVDCHSDYACHHDTGEDLNTQVSMLVTHLEREGRPTYLYPSRRH